MVRISQSPRAESRKRRCAEGKEQLNLPPIKISIQTLNFAEWLTGEREDQELDQTLKSLTQELNGSPGSVIAKAPPAFSEGYANPPVPNRPRTLGEITAGAGTETLQIIHQTISRELRRREERVNEALNR